MLSLDNYLAVVNINNSTSKTNINTSNEIDTHPQMRLTLDVWEIKPQSDEEVTDMASKVVCFGSKKWLASFHARWGRPSLSRQINCCKCKLTRTHTCPHYRSCAWILIQCYLRGWHKSPPLPWDNQLGTRAPSTVTVILCGYADLTARDSGYRCSSGIRNALALVQVYEWP